MLLGKDVLKICSIFTGEHPWRNVISIKLQSIILDHLFIRTAMEGCLNYKWHCSDAPVTNFNPFHATDLFWYPMKTSENQRFSNVFRGYQNRSVTWNGLTHLLPALSFDSPDNIKKPEVENQIGSWQVFLSLFFQLIICLLINSILLQTQKIRV